MAREISLPFRLDGNGNVAATSDPMEVGRTHLTTYLLTDPGERVMRPDLGTPIKHEVFEPLDVLRAQLLVSRINDKVAFDVPQVHLLGVSAAEDSEQAALLLNVEFALAVGEGQGATGSTTIGVAGGGQAVVTPAPIPVGRAMLLRWNTGSL